MYAERKVGFRHMTEKNWRVKDLYEWTGVEMVEENITRKTSTCLSTLARSGDDRWEVQMLGAELEARKEGKNQWTEIDNETALLKNDSGGNGTHSSAV